MSRSGLLPSPAKHNASVLEWSTIRSRTRVIMSFPNMLFGVYMWLELSTQQKSSENSLLRTTSAILTTTVTSVPETFMSTNIAATTGSQSSLVFSTQAKNVAKNTLLNTSFQAEPGNSVLGRNKHFERNLHKIHLNIIKIQFQIVSWNQYLLNKWLIS